MQNTAISTIWLIRQKICFAIPQKSENFAEKQPDTIQPLTLTRQHYIVPGRTRLHSFGESPEKKLSPHIGNRALQKNSILGYMLLTVDHFQFCFSVSLICRWYSLEKIKENKEFKEFKKFNFCYRQTLISFPVRNK